MAIKLKVTDREGTVRVVEGEVGDKLMTLLRDNNFGIEGTCGGECSCGTCHAFIGAELLATLEPPEEDEADMVEALADAIEVRPNSRLTCQIMLAAEHDGMALEIAPQL